MKVVLIFTISVVSFLALSLLAFTPKPDSLRRPVLSQTTLTNTHIQNELSIAALKSKPITASHINIEEALAGNERYQRYITSYQSEGLTIFGLLTIPTLPPPEGGWPVIVFIHGNIPPHQYRTTERYVNYIDGFASNGFIVFKPDLRGHGQSEGIATNAYINHDYVVDVLSALAALKRDQAVNPQKIGLWGHSTGGYILLKTIVSDPTIKAGVIWGGVVGSLPEIIASWPETVPDWQTALISTYGLPQANHLLWDSFSANNFLRGTNTPLQLHHAQNDEWVPSIFSILLHQRLVVENKVSEIYLYPSDNHNLTTNFQAALDHSLQFFNKYLVNESI